MTADIKEITIKCPICDGIHQYALNVEYSYTLSMIPLTNISELNNSIQSFTRVFICPNKNEKFQSTIKFSDSIKIDSLSVIGIKK